MKPIRGWAIVTKEENEFVEFHKKKIDVERNYNMFQRPRLFYITQVEIKEVVKK